MVIEIHIILYLLYVLDFAVITDDWGFSWYITKEKQYPQLIYQIQSLCRQSKTLRLAQKKISIMPPKSALILTDETNGEVTKEVVAAIMEFAKNNTPYVKASAVVGAEKLKAIMLTNVATMVGRDIKSFETRTRSLWIWLVSQS